MPDTVIIIVLALAGGLAAGLAWRERAARFRTEALLTAARQTRGRELASWDAQLQDEIADRTMVSQHLRQVHEIHRAIIAASPLAIFSLDRERRITSWNPAAERIYGYASAELLGKEFPSPPGAASQVEERVRHHSNVMAGKTVRNVEIRRMHKGGAMIDILFSANPLYDDKGDIRGMVVVSEDVTQVRSDQGRARQLQEELAHVARVSAMGQMSAAIAHELNQPLTAITNYVKAAQRHLSAPEPSPLQIEKAREIMEKAAGQTIRAGSIIRALRGFVEKRESEKTEADINEMITAALALGFIHSADSNVKVVTDLADNLPPVELDKVQIQQVLTNLIRNAVEAMGAVTQRQLTLTSALDGDFVRITVADSGPGLAPDIAAQLFKPFRTTKSDGMGIGLAICQSIIEGHGGSIRAIEQDGPGAVFEICLPLRQRQDRLD